MNCTKHFDLSSSLTASCVARFMICWVCRLYFSGLVCSVLSLDECLIKINYGRFCVCFRCLEKVILWSRLCLAKDEFRYHHKHVYLILLSEMNDFRRLVNMTWYTNTPVNVNPRIPRPGHSGAFAGNFPLFDERKGRGYRWLWPLLRVIQEQRGSEPGYFPPRWTGSRIGRPY